MIQDHVGSVVGKTPLTEVVEAFSNNFGLGPGCRGRGEKSTALAEVIDVKPNAVSDWMLGEYLPRSDRKAKLLLLLFLCGYETQERLGLSAEAVTFSDIVATTTGIDQVVIETGLDDPKVRRYLHSGFSIAREPELQAFIERYHEAKETKVSLWKSELKKHGFLNAKPEVSSPQSVEAVKSVNIEGYDSSPVVCLHEESQKFSSKSPISLPVIKSAAGMVLALKPLIDLLLSADSSPEIRDSFREIAGQRNVFDLKNCLTRLCGETAFKNN